MIEGTVPDVRGLAPGGYRGAAVALSVLGHALAIAVLVFAMERTIQKSPEAPPVRLVFVEPAPPPRLGAPGGGAIAGPALEPEANPGASAPLAAPPLAPIPAAPTKPEPVQAHAHPKPAAQPTTHATTHAAIERPRPEPATDDAAPPAVERSPAEPRPEGAIASTGGGSGRPAGPAAGVADGDVAGAPGGIPGGQVGGLGTQLLPAGQAAVAPAIVRQVMPVYPEVARARGIEGQVVLEAIIATDGHIEPDIKVVHSVPALDAAAIEAFRRWRFSPARDASGQPVRVILQAPVRFVLR